MTQMGEGVAFLAREVEREQECEHPDEKVVWKCKLDGKSSSLEKNLWDHCGVPKPANVPSVKLVTYSSWPSQAHHLIPWQQLRKHPITQWLAEKPPKAPARLWADNDYSVDHGMNGKFMPYVAALAEWKHANGAEKQELAEVVMGAAGIQLHQGPHSYKEYGVGEAGYKTRVAEYLQYIHRETLNHYHGPPACEDCAEKAQAKKLPPRRNVVRFVDRASSRLEIDINMGRIFVSRRAASFAGDGGVMG